MSNNKTPLTHAAAEAEIKKLVAEYNLDQDTMQTIMHTIYGGIDDETRKCGADHTEGINNLPDANALIKPEEYGCWVQVWAMISHDEMNDKWQGERDEWQGKLNVKGIARRYTSHYRCDDCDQSWSKVGSRVCNDECSECGKSYAPKETTFTGPQWLQDIWDDWRSNV